MIDDGGSSAASQVPSPDNSGAADLLPTAPETNAGRLDAPPARQENAPPMLDVHAPREAVHTWKDFFIHLATIVIGLLIAVGLEQTVEYFHHQHQVAEIRRSLAEERRINEVIFTSASSGPAPFQWTVSNLSFRPFPIVYC